jgi:hypothetical protein
MSWKFYHKVIYIIFSWLQWRFCRVVGFKAENYVSVYPQVWIVFRGD